MRARLETPLRAGLLCFALGLLVALAAALAQRDSNRQLVRQRFETVALGVAESVATSMRSFEFGLRGMRGVAVAQGGIPRLEQVRRYAASRDIDREFPGARGFGFIWRVDERDEAALVARMRADGHPDFRIRQITPHAGERFVICTIEPEGPNRAAVGLDIASEPRRRSAALAAQASGRPSITEPITLVQASGKAQRSFLLLLPIHGLALAGIDAGEDGAVAGWSYAPVVSDEVFATLHLPENLVWIEFRDAQSTVDGRFYNSDGAEPADAALPARDIAIPMYNRQWVAHIRARPALAQEMHLTSPLLLGLAGALVAALLGGVAYLLTQRRERSRGMLVERASRAAMVDASEDGIVNIRLDGTITEWNRGAERLFGFTAAEVLGRPIAEVLPQPAWLDEDVAILAGARAGRPLPPFETQRRHRDGSLVDVSVGAAPIHDEKGQLVSLAKTFRDIREAKAARRELEALNASLESQVRERTAELDRTLHDLRSIVDALPSMIGYWDRELRNRMANRAYAEWFGVEPAQLEGRSIAELLGPELYQQNRAHIEAALRGEPQSFERGIARPDGQGVRHSLAHYLPDVVDGVVRGFYVLVHDVSELQEQRVALEAEKRDKAALLATIDAHAIVAVTDRNGTITAVNERFSRISGYPAGELVGQTHRVVKSGTHPPAFWQTMWETLGRAATWRGEICNRARDGSLYWVECVIAPFLDGHGHIEKIISFSTDVTARKRAELELRQALATLESVLRSATRVAIVATDAAGVVKLFNRGAEILLGYEAEEVIGKRHATDWLVPEEVEARAAEIGAALTQEGGLDAPFDCHYVRKEGSWVPVTLAVTRIADRDGAALGFIHIAYDIGNRLAQEAALKQAATAAQQANQAKSLFLANMSHEIRTPLNAVIGLAHLLGRTTLDSEQAEYVANIGAAGESLLTIVSDVLDLSKIEAGEMPLEHVTFSLRDLCSDLQALFDAQARMKGLALRLLPGAGLPDALSGDPTRLRQILVNLLGNALKFTADGAVELAIERLGSDDRPCRLRFEVRDTGVGIDADALDHLFQPFAQADASTTRRFGGTGLGLSIVKNLAEMMGGSVDVRSTPGAGSCFGVELPFGLGNPAMLMPKVKRSEQGRRLQGVRVLLVDDSEINLTVAGRLLEIEGAVVTRAANGAEAVAIARVRPDLQVVLMDIQMPVMDGLEAARAIRQEWRGPPLPILALTAGNTETERRRALDAGFVAVLSKPIDPERLIQGLQRVLAPGAEALPAAVAPDAADWPMVDGIDGNQACQRFAGDASLFLRMLEQTVDSCSAAAAMPTATAPQREALAGAMHRLKGNAGTLAAQALAAAAERAERACQQGKAEELAAALDEVRGLALRQRRAAAPWIGPAGAPATAEAPSAAAVASNRQPDRDGLARLLRALRSQDLLALELFREARPLLQALLGADEVDALSEHLKHLRFGPALALLAQAGVA